MRFVLSWGTPGITIAAKLSRRGVVTVNNVPAVTNLDGGKPFWQGLLFCKY